MREQQHLSRITLIFNQQASRQVVWNLKVLSHRIMQVPGVRSVLTELDMHGRQQFVIFTNCVDYPALLRRMSAELRRPAESGSLAPIAAPGRESGFVSTDLVPSEPVDIKVLITTESRLTVERRGIVKPLRQFFFGSLAVASVGMAWVGLLVPGIPTVPFVIMAAMCGAKASPAFRRKLKQTRVFGPMISDWDKHGAVRPEVRIQAVALTVVIVAITVTLAQPSPPLLMVMGGMLMMTLVIIACIPVISPEQLGADAAPSPERPGLPAVA